jgi:hypothetical protein
MGRCGNATGIAQAVRDSNPQSVCSRSSSTCTYHALIDTQFVRLITNLAYHIDTSACTIYIQVTSSENQSPPLFLQGRL